MVQETVPVGGHVANGTAIEPQTIGCRINSVAIPIPRLDRVLEIDARTAEAADVGESSVPSGVIRISEHRKTPSVWSTSPEIDPDRHVKLHRVGYGFAGPVNRVSQRG